MYSSENYDASTNSIFSKIWKGEGKIVRVKMQKLLCIVNDTQIEVACSINTVGQLTC